MSPSTVYGPSASPSEETKAYARSPSVSRCAIAWNVPDSTASVSSTVTFSCVPDSRYALVPTTLPRVFPSVSVASWIVTNPPSGTRTSSTTTVLPPDVPSAKLTLAPFVPLCAATPPAAPATADTTTAIVTANVNALLRMRESTGDI